MTTVNQLAVLITALAKAEAKVIELRARRDEAIVDLLDQGLTSDTVAFYAGMTQPRCVQIKKAHTKRRLDAQAH